MATVSEAYALALDYQRSGHFEYAEQICRRIVESVPAHADAWSLLGILAYQAGDGLRAVGYMSRAVALRPDEAAFHNDLGVMQATRGKPREAVACYLEALRLDPRFADAHNNLGNAYKDLGKLEDAVASYRKARRLRPDYAAACNNLGTALQELGRLARAEGCYREALRLKPDLHQALANLGDVLRVQGRVEESVTCLQQALSLYPDYAHAHNNFGFALLLQGETDQAIAHFESALRLRPGLVLGYYGLSVLAAEGLYEFSQAKIDHIKGLLAGKMLSTGEAGRLHFTLARVFDRQGRIDEAFAHYRQGNDLRSEYFRQRGTSFDPEAHRRLIDNLIAAFDKDYFTRVRPFGLDTELPVFIVGMPRSGSTLVEQILCSHRQVFGAGELRDIPELVAHLSATLHAPEQYPACLTRLDGPAIGALARGQLQRLARRGGQATRVIDKELRNFLHIGIIHTLFPCARIIHCVRDPLDTCLSCYQLNFEAPYFTTSLEHLGFYYRQYRRLMTHWQEVLPTRMFEVRYEDLVAYPETLSRTLVAFCGLEWDERCLHFHQNPRAVRTASMLQVRRPIYRSAVGRWKRYQAHLGPLIEALGKD